MPFPQAEHSEGTLLSLNIDVLYDYDKKIWINGISKTKFDENFWCRRENKTPIYPVMNDLLGDGIILKWKLGLAKYLGLSTNLDEIKIYRFLTKFMIKTKV